MSEHRKRTGTCLVCGTPVSRLFCSRKCIERDRHKRFREEHGISRSGMWARELTGDKRESYLQRVREQQKRRVRNDRKRESEQRRRAVKRGARLNAGVLLTPSVLESGISRRMEGVRRIVFRNGRLNDACCRT